MGKLMLYGAGRACQSIMAYSGNDTTTYNTFKATNGETINTLQSGTDNTSGALNNLKIFINLNGYISGDTINDFSLEHYTTRELSNISYVRTSARNINGIIYTITATNNGTDTISVNSIKFTKPLNTTSGTSTTKTCLICGYFLDELVTIEAGKTKTFAVNIDCWNY